MKGSLAMDETRSSDRTRDSQMEKRHRYIAQWRKDHPENVRRMHERNRTKNRDKIRARDRVSHRQAREAHPAKFQKKDAKFYADHREQRLAYQRAYAATHRAERTAYGRARRLKLKGVFPVALLVSLEKDPAKEHTRAQKRLQQSRRNARKRALPATFTMEQREFMRQYWGFACVYCGNQDGFVWMLADDHFIPLNSPNCPGTVAHNMLPVCHGKGGCNNSKRFSHPHVWLVARFGPQRSRRIEAAIAVYFAVVKQRESH